MYPIYAAYSMKNSWS